VTVLDAYAVVAFLRGEPAADEVATLLRDPTVISSINVAEVIDQLVRVFGRDSDDVYADIALLSHAGMDVLSVPAELAVHAGRLRAKHYHRERMAVSLADCVAAATALSMDKSLATSDPALAALIRAEGGDIHGLPDSKGQLP
jgi:predicted nucleic acid-binding protein